MYAQTSYTQRLGNSEFSIADTGSLLIAFANLLERYGNGIDPSALNDFFNEHGTFIAGDDGLANLLSYGSISAYNNQVSVIKHDLDSWPTSNDAIVRFQRINPSNGQAVSHYCLVSSCNDKTIVDSYDGQVKDNPYGIPASWVVYACHEVQPLTVPFPTDVQPFTVEEIDPRNETLQNNTFIWDLKQSCWPSMVNSPIAVAPIGTTFQAVAVAHHIFGDFYMSSIDSTQGYAVEDCQALSVMKPLSIPIVARLYTENTVDGIHYKAFDQPKQMWVVTNECHKLSFSDIITHRDFKAISDATYGQEVFVVGKAQHPVPPNGKEFYMVTADFGDFKKTGKVVNLAGYAVADLRHNRPAPKPVLPVVEQIAYEPEEDVTQTSEESEWHNSWTPYEIPVKYMALEAYEVKNLDNLERKGIILPKDWNIVISGTFIKDGILYGRPRDAVTAQKFYGIPLNEDLIRRHDQIFSTVTTVEERQITHTLKKRDYVALGFDKIDSIAGRIVKGWDIHPNKIKNKKES